MYDLPFFQDHPYRDLFIMILLEEAGVFFPIPGDAVLLLFGVASREGTVNFITTLLIVCAATFLGASLLYIISRWLGRILLDRYGHLLKYIHITEGNIRQVERWMERYGWFALVFARVTPGLRIVGTVAAGVLNVPYHTFITATMTGTLIWVSVFYSLGWLLGRRYGQQIGHLMENHVLLLFLAFFSVLFWIGMARYVVPRLRQRFSSLQH